MQEFEENARGFLDQFEPPEKCLDTEDRKPGFDFEDFFTRYMTRRHDVQPISGTFDSITVDHRGTDVVLENAVVNTNTRMDELYHRYEEMQAQLEDLIARNGALEAQVDYLYHKGEHT